MVRVTAAKLPAAVNKLITPVSWILTSEDFFVVNNQLRESAGPWLDPWLRLGQYTEYTAQLPAEYIIPNLAPESLYATQITGLYHPLITLHITVTEQPKIKVASRSLSSLLAPTPLPTHTPGGDERAKKKTVEKRLFSRAKLHWNAESCLFSTQLTVTANVRNVPLLKLGRSDTCDAENST